MRARHFEITYCLNNGRRVFVQPDSHMSDEDALYYACLHAGVFPFFGDNDVEGHHDRLLEHARQFELTDVRWEELPTA